MRRSGGRWESLLSQRWGRSSGKGMLVVCSECGEQGNRELEIYVAWGRE